jgi:hypothetical protein
MKTVDRMHNIDINDETVQNKAQNFQDTHKSSKCNPFSSLFPPHFFMKTIKQKGAD